MGIEVKKLRSDNETYICNIENGISVTSTTAEEEEKLINLITCQTGKISILCIFCETSSRILAKAWQFAISRVHFSHFTLANAWGHCLNLSSGFINALYFHALFINFQRKLQLIEQMDDNHVTNSPWRPPFSPSDGQRHRFFFFYVVQSYRRNKMWWEKCWSSHEATDIATFSNHGWHWLGSD